MMDKSFKANFFNKIIKIILRTIVSIILCELLFAIIGFINAILRPMLGQTYILPFKAYSMYIFAAVALYNIYYVFVKKKIEIEVKNDNVKVKYRDNLIGCDYDIRNTSIFIEKRVTQTYYLIPVFFKYIMKVLPNDGKVIEYDLYAFSNKDFNELKKIFEGAVK